MNNNIFRSFRFEIVLYSLLSLLYTLLTLAVVYIGAYLVFQYDPGNLNGTPFVIMVIITAAAGIVLFITYFLLLTQKFVIYIKKIASGINEISMGNFDNRIIIKNEDEFALIAEKLNHMADDIKEIMENKRRSEYAKNELITSVAHDLRTPLTSIIGYLDLVSNKELPPDIQKNYISIAYNKSKRLENLIEDLFTYTKFNFGEVKAIYAPVDMVKLINQLLDEFYPSFAENNLEYEYNTHLPIAVIMADGDLLARAFANLISNAIKYGRDGRYILLNLEESGNGDGILLTVKNYGNIISPKDLEQIFERFYRIESSRSSETGGSGLGLAIAKSIIEMHRGRIWAESDATGTKFNVELKREPLAE